MELGNNMFIVAIENLDKVRSLAVRAQLDVTVEPVCAETVQEWASAESLRLIAWGLDADFAHRHGRRSADKRAIGLRTVTLTPSADRDIVPVASAHTGVDRLVKYHSFGSWWTGRESASFRSTGAPDFTRCDMCGRRIARNAVYILRRDGALQQVGGSCADSLNAAGLIEAATRSIESIRSEWTDGYATGNNGCRVPLVSFAAIWTVLHQYGYVSRKTAEENLSVSTASRVSECFDSNSRCRDVADRAREYAKDPECDKMFQECLAWAEGVAQAPKSDFDLTMFDAIRTGSESALGYACFGVARWIEARLAARVASLPQVYYTAPTYPEGALAAVDAAAAMCEMTRDALIEAMQLVLPKKQSSRVKNLDKLLPGVWIAARPVVLDGFYGTTYIVRLTRLSDGARVEWRTGTTTYGVAAGDEIVALRASVGEDLPAHPRYGFAGTSISRVTWTNRSKDAREARDLARRQAAHAASRTVDPFTEFATA
jgi:hypothetical protein